MKNTLLAVLTLILPFIIHAEVRNSLEIKNNTEKTVLIAYGWYNKVEQCWKSRGWFEIKPYKSFVRDLNGLDLGNHNMYISVKADHIEWSGNTELRVDHNNVFEISFADKLTPKLETAKFKSVLVDKGNRIFVINP
jgi:uncharacterized membrane protein